MSSGEDGFTQRQLRDYVQADTTVYTLTTYAKTLTDYVRVFVVKDGEIEELTYLVARLTGTKVIEDRGGIVMPGGGYGSKGLRVFKAVCSFAGVKADPERWREL